MLSVVRIYYQCVGSIGFTTWLIKYKDELAILVEWILGYDVCSELKMI
jgi:hypothetical protein